MQKQIEFNLAEWRLKANLSQAQLANLLNASPTTIFRMEQKGAIPRMLQWALVGIAQTLYADQGGVKVPTPELEAHKKTFKSKKKKYFMNGAELGFNPFKGA